MKKKLFLVIIFLLPASGNHIFTTLRYFFSSELTQSSLSFFQSVCENMKPLAVVARPLCSSLVDQLQQSTALSFCSRSLRQGLVADYSRPLKIQQQQLRQQDTVDQGLLIATGSYYWQLLASYQSLFFIVGKDLPPFSLGRQHTVLASGQHSGIHSIDRSSFSRVRPPARPLVVFTSPGVTTNASSYQLDGGIHLV